MKKTILLISFCLLLLVPFSSASGAEKSTSPWRTAPAESPQAIGLKVDLLPHNPPVQIPSFGGYFEYTLDVLNATPKMLAFEVWTTYRLPDGSFSDPVFGPVRLQLPSGWSADRYLQQFVPDDMPAGMYLYTAHIGRYPDRILDSDVFAFSKMTNSSGWYSQNSGIDEVLFDVHFVDEQNGWIVGGNKILHTSDGGDNWHVQNSPTFESYYAVHFSDQNNGWISGSSGTILHTSNGGNNWIKQDSGYDTGAYRFYGVFFVDSDNGWVVGGASDFFGNEDRVILHTADGGQNWETQLFDNDEMTLFAVFFTDLNTGWAVGDGKTILHTDDGGLNWVPQDGGTGSYYEDVFFIDANTGWIPEERSNFVLRTTDGGQTWDPHDTGANVTLSQVVFVDSNNGWVVGGDNDYGRILRTTDGGITWHDQDTENAPYLIGIDFANINNGWAVGWDGTVLHTETGGE